MDPLALAAGTAIVSAMATGAWQQVQAAVVALWRRAHADRAATVDTELTAVRGQVLAARERADDDTEQALVGVWRLRLQELLNHDPAIAADLRELLDGQLTPALPPAEQARVRQISINAKARDHARQNIAGRDLHITGS